MLRRKKTVVPKQVMENYGASMGYGDAATTHKTCWREKVFQICCNFSYKFILHFPLLGVTAEKVVGKMFPGLGRRVKREIKLKLSKSNASDLHQSLSQVEMTPQAEKIYLKLKRK